ncbi:Reverse transcriptase-RNase H-integrase [Phytophthora palmivora]|uniref:RNA-directed DNA polymerase n=1 Tax=Phytophthora palmivora TaxID=4796 RepID=A0A2P4Y2D4_9STRA|nr:Reverse transcriptase-RNase H-integrase [Phytophthora palmivora]
MDLAVKFEDFDSTESFLVLDMAKYDLILGMPWLEKHEPCPNAECRRAVWASTVAVPDGTDQAVPRKVEETEKKNESAACVSSVGNRVTRGVKKTSTSAEVSLSTSRVDNQAGAVHLEALPEMSALLNLEELSMKDVLYGTDLMPGTKYYVTRQWSLPREQCEVIDAFFAENAKSGMVRESKSPHSTPTFCVRKSNRMWRLVHAYNKLNNATVPAQTPIPRKDVLLNNMSGCTLYSALDLVDGYYQILMRESDIPLTAQKDEEGRERVISFQSRQLKAAERNYPVHDKDILAMKYALVKFRVHLLGARPFVIYTDHASLRTVTNSPHLSQRMARWLSFFVEYNFRVEYKPIGSRLICTIGYALRINRTTTTPMMRFLPESKDAKVDRLSP